ncbi:hypothetical protein CS063_01905 [Sporanaerobium hydrogeniformans]|uniref:Uncharacterized protein n=1 Tax=Sporanaerobium hydrogeniformans TaxID=3072179 RepID=A0AC61DG62_9FIRM|nr:response regulator [Sporanaerobium hydrogeniformans]PHV72254.1 hypothetical protein CS063_01905 [Sporanaerobium hydrogeniformans]
MFRVLVIDDEPYLRKNIITSIQKANPQFQVIAEAGDGLQALELIKDLQPDVIFLDIRMPLMDGITLLEELQSLSSIPICVILSGYSEFEYAKKALRYQVLDYILKPIHQEKLEILLKEIQERLLSSQLTKQYNYLLHVFRGVSLTIKTEEIHSIFSSFTYFYSVYLSAGSYVCSKNNQFNPIDDFWSNYHLDQLFTRYIQSPHQAWFITGENPNEHFIILGIDTEVPHYLNALTNELLDLSHQLPYPLTVIKGKTSSSLSELKNDLIDLKYASILLTRYGTTSFSSCTEQLTLTLEDIGYSHSQHKILCALNKTHPTIDFLREVNQLFDQCKQKKCPQVLLQTLAKQLLLIVTNNKHSISNEERVDELITNTYCYEDFKSHFGELILELSASPLQENLIDTIADIKTYIDNHFTEQLSLDSISKKFHVSSSYFSVLFKKNYAISPNEYIINKRIEKAKNLLLIFPPLSIKNISNMVGYTDPYYFSRLFKMTSGMTPSNYRAQIFSKE